MKTHLIEVYKQKIIHQASSSLEELTQWHMKGNKRGQMMITSGFSRKSLLYLSSNNVSVDHYKYSFIRLESHHSGIENFLVLVACSLLLVRSFGCLL